MTGSSARDWTTPGGLTTDEHPQSSTTCRAKPSRAKRGLAERSEALPREARQAAEGGQHFDVPEPREGPQTKQGCDSTAATQLPRLNCLGRRESVLCTYGILHLMNLKAEISWIKGGPGPQTGGTPPEPIWRPLATWRRVLRTML